MCGILGIVQMQSPSLGEARLRELGQRGVASLRHRGPDENGLWTGEEGSVLLGHARLSILDLSTGSQPMLDVTGRFVIVFNGEIYNYVELRSELRQRGHQFRTGSDTEVLLEGYKEWGADCLGHLNGMFSFALWDSTRRRLFAARDRMGEKGFYYAGTPGAFYFASEPKALFALGVKREFEPSSLADYLTFRAVPAPGTLFRNVFKLPAGHALVLDHQSEPHLHRYWSLPDASEAALPEKECEEELIHRLSESVRLRLRSDVPVAAFLSGGVDSSLVTALMALQEGKNDPIHTFSVTVEDEQIDESPFQQIVSKKYGTVHTSCLVTEREMLAAARQWYHYCDDLVADPAAIALQVLAGLVHANGIKVALSGEGADELLAGYGSYLLLQRRMRQRNTARHFASLNPLLRIIARRFPARKRYALESILEDRMLFEGTSSVFAKAERDGLQLNIPDAATAPGVVHSLKDALRYDLTYRLPDDIFVRTDRATMANSVESRIPFVDHTLVEWIARLPESMLIRNGETKYILKRSAEPYLPKHLLYRRKIGFDLPLDRWLAGPFHAEVRAFFFEEKRIPGVCYDACAKVYDDWRQRTVGSTGRLWYLYALECWYREWFMQ